MSGKFERANSQIECCLFILREVSTPERLQYTSHDRPRFRNGSPVPGHLLLTRWVGKSLYWTNMWRLRHSASSRRLHESTVVYHTYNKHALTENSWLLEGFREGLLRKPHWIPQGWGISSVAGSHCGGLGSIPGWSLGLLWTKCQLGRFSQSTSVPPTLQRHSNGVPTMYNVSNWQRRWTRLNLSGWTNVRSKGSSR